MKNQVSKSLYILFGLIIFWSCSDKLEENEGFTLASDVD